MEVIVENLKEVQLSAYKKCNKRDFKYEYEIGDR